MAGAAGALNAESPPEALPTDDTAQALLSKTFGNLYDGDFVQVIRLTSRSGTGRSMTRRLQIVRKESEPPGRAVIRFLTPPDVRGTSMLVIEQDSRADDVFIYLPAFAQTKRISSAQRYDSFFGTNLTYEDLEPKHAVDFEAQFVGRGEVVGVGCLRLKVQPRPAVESQYDFTVSCIDAERSVALWTEYFLEERMIKRMEVDPASIRFRKGRFIPHAARLASSSSGFVTEISTESLEFYESIPDRLFSTPNLEMGSDGSDLRVLRDGNMRNP